MGILPLQFLSGESAHSLGLTGEETYSIGIASGQLRSLLDSSSRDMTINVRATRRDGTLVEFPVSIRIDTPQERLYYQHGGILQYVLRQLATVPQEVVGA